MTDQTLSTGTPDTENTTVENTEEQGNTQETVEQEDDTLLGSQDEGSQEEEDTGSAEEAKEIPEKYDIKLEEGMELDEETLEMFTPIFKELGITNEGAQKLVDAYVPLIQSMADKTREQGLKEFNEIKAEWKADTMKELGADAKTKLIVCSRAIDKFGSDSLRETLNQTGLGNHKDFVNLMIKVGETITEDTLEDADGKSSNAPKGDPLRKMYPSMFKT